MALRFVTGGSGSGRSTFLFEEVIKEAIARPDMTFIVIVPEQNTMQTQKLLVNLHPRRGIMNIEVLSFERLAFRVFDELGTDTLTVLGETGKMLVLRRLASEMADELPILGVGMKKPGFLSEMKSLISELSQYHISPEEFLTSAKASRLSSYEKSKISEISRLYRAFFDFIDKSFITSEQVLELLCDIVEDSGIVRDSVMVFDGFTGFTPLQNELLIKFMTMCSDIRVSVTIDPKISMFSDIRDEELFAMSKRMAKKLLAMAKMTRTDVAEPIVLEMDEASRFPSNSELKYLSDSVFRDNKPYEGERGRITVAALKDPRRELSYAFATIRRLVRTEGYRYRDFAIISADAPSYFDYVDETAGEYGIPCFKDEKARFKFSPFIEYLKGALLIAVENASFRSMVHFLKSGMTGLSSDETDRFELYLDASGMRGFSAYKRTLRYRPSDTSEEELIALDATRERIAELLTPFMEVAKKKNATVRQIAFSLYELSEKCDAPDDEIYDFFVELLDKMVDLIGDEEVGAEEFLSLFSAGMETAKLGRIPASNDSVIVGDLIRTRIDDVKVLFLLGANDGVIPKEVSRGGLLTQTDRLYLKDTGMELAPSDREQAFAQRFYLYLMLSKPSGKLFVTYSLLDNAGASRVPSYLIRTLKTLFPYLKIETDEGTLWMESPDTSAARLIDTIHSEEINTDDEADAGAVVKYLTAHDGGRLFNIIKAADTAFAPDPIRKATMLAANGQEIRGSISRLEQYASCAYKYFLQYILALRVRQKKTLEAVDIGTLYHDALYEYEKGVSKSGISMGEISDEESERILKESIRVAYERINKPQALSDARERYILIRAEDTLRRTVRAITNQVAKSSFVPKYFEVELSELSGGEAIKMELSDESFMRLSGRIDRIDECDDGDALYIKIIDYKSAAKKLDLNDVYDGRQLQLLYYLKSAKEAIAKGNPEKEVRPGAVLYYRVSDPYVDADWEMDDAAIDDRVQKSFEPDGFFAEVMKAKNEISVRKSTVSDDDFSLYTDYVADKMRRLGKSIGDGRVAPNPFSKDNKSPCDYCEYSAVCAFDVTIPGYEYRHIKSRSADEIKEMMTKAVTGEQGD